MDENGLQNLDVLPLFDNFAVLLLPFLKQSYHHREIFVEFFQKYQ